MKLGEQCEACGLKVTKEHKTSTGYADPCLGVLPGVKFACCGHQDPMDQPYLFFENGVVIRMDHPPVVEKLMSTPHHRFEDRFKE